MKPQRRGALLVLGVLIVSAVLGGIYGPPVRATAAGASDVQDSVKTFTRVLSVVQRNYAVPIDPDRALYSGAVPAMLRLLDPHSNFFDPRQYALLREDQRGRYYGVGMTVGQQEDHTVVLAPMPGSPASKAGIRPGDIIATVEGKPCQGLTTSEVADMLKGPKGTVVRVEVLREGAEEPIKFTITRDEIPRFSVEHYFHLRPGVGYIRLVGFNENTHDEIANALEALGGAKLDGLILDLRDNPGGLLNEGVAVSDMFLDKNQLVVSHKGRSQRPRNYYASRGTQGRDFPLVILINRYTASAAEIVAGAVQDHDRGLIVGETSFGKGLVQTVFPLSDNTGLALTTARYYTPSGRLIQRDYTAVSLYNYYYSQNRENNTHDSFTTDGGRTVYGGGGITPDVEVPSPELNPFQQELGRKLIFFPYDPGVGDFAKRYLAQHPDVPRDFEATAEVLDEFRRFLNEKNFRFTETDIQDNLGWIKLKIKKEVFTSVFGRDEAARVAVLADPQVQRGVELLPEAKALRENLRRTIARQPQKE